MSRDHEKEDLVPGIDAQVALLAVSEAEIEAEASLIG